MRLLDQPFSLGLRMLIHGASGGVGSAMLQLAKLARVEMFGTCSMDGAAVVWELGGIPIDYKNADFVKERDCVHAAVIGSQRASAITSLRARCAP